MDVDIKQEQNVKQLMDSDVLKYIFCGKHVSDIYLASPLNFVKQSN
jgi:hypothetical protein